MRAALASPRHCTNRRPPRPCYGWGMVDDGKPSPRGWARPERAEEPLRIGRIQRPAVEEAGLLQRIVATGSLPEEMQTAAARRLGIVALTVAVAFIAFFLAFLASGGPDRVSRSLVSAYGGRAILALAPVINISSIVASLVLFGLTRRKDACPDTLLRIGVGYQLLVALSIGILTHLVPWPATGFPVAWPAVGVWIILFAALVPSKPRRTLIVSTAAAAMDPLGLALTHGLGAPLPSTSQLMMFYTPLVLSIGAAVACSVILHRLGRDIEEARRLGAYELVELLGKGGMGEVWSGGQSTGLWPDPPRSRSSARSHWLVKTPRPTGSWSVGSSAKRGPRRCSSPSIP